VLPKAAIEKIQKEYFFYIWDENPPATLWPSSSQNENFKEVRWMCAWDTRIEEVEDFVAVVRNSL